MKNESRLPKKQNLRTKIRQNLKSISMGFMAVFSAIAIPVWQVYFVETSDIKVEIASIIRKESDGTNIALNTDELAQLELYIPETLLYEYDKQGKRGDKLDFPTFSLSVLLKSFDKAKQDIKNIADINNALRGYQVQIQNFISDKNDDFQLIEFRIANLKEWNLSRYIEDSEASYYEDQLLAITRSYSSMTFDANNQPIINLKAVKSLLIDVDEDLSEVSSDNIKRLNRLRDDIRNIESQLEKLQKSQTDKYSFFEVELVVTNNGRVSTSLRPLALMRIQISENNYADVILKMKNYSQNAELDSAATKIIRFTSEQIISFPKDDQRMVNSFWGSTAWFHIYTMNTSQEIFISNRVAFADSLNQKFILDKLKDKASDHMIN
ncbi:hypothetical protein [Pseudoalteromonas denitrificans]|uniref:Uncharacterized protein n=1 Tax=Pseudoalteromonas denitrificans DSM 6059 TaxID=1123010 RepID=A0A1I1GN12_9GAMM|nr:hypothetical protein [Pseudoalteromonas denitrificans]SFC13004.1 hypothetical protein SAMN02745724_00967 [Pseudoalteromonas denitrificans DSM 6059]